jgi:hypothetical protein
MHKLLAVALAALLQAPAWAQTALPALTGPTEVGTTTMAAGQYQVTDKTNGKVYDLMVTGKGNMILSPSAAASAGAAASAATGAPQSAAATPPAATPPAATPPAATPPAAVSPPAVIAAPVAATAAVSGTAAGATQGASSTINNLVNQGVQRGMSELMKRGATNQLKNLVK